MNNTILTEIFNTVARLEYLYTKKAETKDKNLIKIWEDKIEKTLIKHDNLVYTYKSINPDYTLCFDDID